MILNPRRNHKCKSRFCRSAGHLAGHAGIRAGIPDQPDTSPA